jgi:hypothetical protein
MEMALNGTLMEVDFPFEELGMCKRRWALTLAEDNEGVWCMYCTTNPEESMGRRPVRLGKLEDGRVSNLVASKVEKFDHGSVRRSQRIRLVAPGVGEDVLRAVVNAAHAGYYPEEVKACVIENAKSVLDIMKARAEKLAAKK